MNKMNKITKNLKKAKKLIKNPDHWCCRAYARDKNGEEVESTDETAIQWCVLGAIRNVLNFSATKNYDLYSLLLFHLNNTAKGMGYITASQVNDCTDHETIMRMFDEAIELSKKKNENFT